MKKCTSCGGAFDDTSRYCPYCGVEYGKTGQETDAAEAYGWQPEKPKEEEKVINTNQGMIWHRILLIILIVNGIWSIITGVSYMSRYRNAEWIAVFRSYSGLQFYIMVCGVVQIAIGVYALIVYNRLRTYKRNGPGSLKMMYIICIAVPLLLQAWQGAILPHARLIERRILFDLLKNIMMLGINNVYYANRKDLFVN